MNFFETFAEKTKTWPEMVRVNIAGKLTTVYHDIYKHINQITERIDSLVSDDDDVIVFDETIVTEPVWLEIMYLMSNIVYPSMDADVYTDNEWRWFKLEKLDRLAVYRAIDYLDIPRLQREIHELIGEHMTIPTVVNGCTDAEYAQLRDLTWLYPHPKCKRQHNGNIWLSRKVMSFIWTFLPTVDNAGNDVTTYDAEDPANCMLSHIATLHISPEIVYTWLISLDAVRIFTDRDQLRVAVESVDYHWRWATNVRYPSDFRTFDQKQLLADPESIFGPIELWDVSNVDDMSLVFKNFGQGYMLPRKLHLARWDVRRVRRFDNMFLQCAVDVCVDKWDTRCATSMMGMFRGACKFNHPVSHFRMSNVTNVSYMFADAETFNQPLDRWDMRQVRDARSMFQGARKFNQPLEMWSIGECINMANMFHGARVFNQPLDTWFVGEIAEVDVRDMFLLALAFHQDLSRWSVSQEEMGMRRLEYARINGKTYRLTRCEPPAKRVAL